MMQQVEIGRLDGLDVEPVAIIERDVDWFEARGIVFSHGLDDLDSYRVAVVEVMDGLTVAVRRYDHAPYAFPDLLIPRKFLQDVRLTEILAGIGYELGQVMLQVAPAPAIGWIAARSRFAHFTSRA